MPAVNSLLLDTTAVIALFRNEPRAVSTLEPIIELYMPLVALGELYLGIERAQNRTKAAQEVEDLLSFVNVLISRHGHRSLVCRHQGAVAGQGNAHPGQRHLDCRCRTPDKTALGRPRRPLLPSSRHPYRSCLSVKRLAQPPEHFTPRKCLHDFPRPNCSRAANLVAA